MTVRVQETLSVQTRGVGFTDITEKVRKLVSASGASTGICSLFLQHTSASILVQENADPTVLSDLKQFFERLAPRSGKYDHDAEGPDDMPGHIKSAVMPTSITLPITSGDLALGTWQAIYLVEHRDASHVRKVVVTVID